MGLGQSTGRDIITWLETSRLSRNYIMMPPAKVRE